MEESIGKASTRAMAWAERTVHRLGTRTFTLKKGGVSGRHENMNTPTAEGAVWLEHELPHVIRQTHIQQLPHHRLLKRDSGSKSVTLTERHSIDRIILPAPTQDTNLTTELPGKEAQSRTSEKLAAEVSPGKGSESSPYIDTRKVADTVYHLMRRDLILERERTTRFGG